jgi:hypothetical protein
MGSRMRIGSALVAVMVVAAIFRRCPGCSWTTDAWSVFVFGILNAVLWVPGTLWVRAGAVVVAAAILVWPRGTGSFVGFAWFVWIPAFMVAWALAREKAANPPADPDQRTASQRARAALAAIVVAVAVGAFAYRLTLVSELQQTAALFVGVPALIAIVVIFAISPRSAVGVACKAVTVGLLISMLLLQEGMLCIAMAAPLFYAVAIALASSVEFVRRRNQSTTMSLIVVLAVTPFSLEGVTRATTVSRDQTVAEVRLVPASAVEVERALFQPPRFDRQLPWYLRAGFPRPVSARIDRDVDGQQWVIQFRGGEMYLNGMEPRTGDLVLALEETRPGFVRWRAVSDSSHMTHFLSWREVSVQYEPVDDASTRVTWTVRYDRGLDPAWYFGPWERYAVHLAANYLIDAVATP